MDIGTVSGIATALSMIAFVVSAVWALSVRRRKDFERMEMLPLEEDIAP